MDSNTQTSNSRLSQEGYDLMGAAFEVHNTIGGGLLEEIYQESLELELAQTKIPFVAHPQLEVSYKNVKLKKRYIPDLVVYGQIVVELKSVAKLLPEHKAQLIIYMRLSSMAVGYLINFGPIEKLEYQRFIL